MKKQWKYNSVAIFDYEKGDFLISDLLVSMKKVCLCVKRSYSPYIGHVSLVIYFDKLIELRKALSLLRQHGFCKDIGSRFEQIVSDLRHRLPYAGWTR